MGLEELRALQERGWKLNQDASTSTAYRLWEDPDGREGGWEIIVQFTSGHGTRSSFTTFGCGLSEVGDSELAALQDAVREARRLMRDWDGLSPER